MSDYGIIFWLIAFTLLAALLIGAYQLLSVRRSQARRGEQPGEATAHPERVIVPQREQHGR